MKEVVQMKKLIKVLMNMKEKAGVLALALAVGAISFAQTAGGGGGGSTAFTLDPTPIADGVRANILAIAGAAVGLLALSIGIAAAFKYARRFLKA